jgi:hypothetical protein
MYIGGWGVEGCKRQAGDARDAHAHARFFGFTDISVHIVQFANSSLLLFTSKNAKDSRRRSKAGD